MLGLDAKLTSLRARTAAAVLSVLLVAAPALAREKVDIVRFDNGDVLTGEVKNFDLGILTLATTGKGTVSIEWVHVASLVSPQVFEVELSSGERLYGSLPEPHSDGELQIIDGPFSQAVPLNQVVGLAPIEQQLWSRLHGAINFGFNFTSANKATTTSFSGQLRTRRKNYEWTLSASANRSTRADTAPTSRADGSYVLNYFLGERWFVPSFANVQQNEELDLQLRTTVGAGIGRFLVQTNRTVLAVTAQADANRERYFSTEEGAYNAELMFGVAYQYFTFSGLKTNLSTSLELIPSLSERGRYRLEFDGSYRHELFKDFYLSLQVYYSWDSKPPTESASSTDWGTVTSIGWSF